MKKTLHINGAEIVLESLVQRGGELQFMLNGKPYHFRAGKRPDGTQLLEQMLAEHVMARTAVLVWQSGKDAKRVQLGALEAKLSEGVVVGGAAHGGVAELSPTAPMPGLEHVASIGILDN